MNTEVTSVNFEEKVLKRSESKPVLVDFWAEWCDPCLILIPILNELHEEEASHWDFVKIHADEASDLAEEFDIRSIPALRMFYKREIIGHFNGLMYKQELKRWITELLNKTK